MKKFLFCVLVLAATGLAAQRIVDVPFQGTCIDIEDGDISTAMVWESDVDGVIFTGASGTYGLTEGPHTITATCTDSGGLSANESVSIVVDFNDPPAVTIQLPADGSTISN